MICNECGDDYPMERAKLGYITCLECGEKVASRLAEKRKKQVGIAYNKGAYQYITEGDLKWLGR